MPDVPELFAALLQRYRARAGLSQEELAERAGLSRRGISDLERGERLSPRPATVRQLAAGLGLHASEHAAFLASAHAAPSGALHADGLELSRHLVDPGHNLPSPLSSFVGRGDAISELRLLLATARLLTLTGPGGIGKTRLALTLAETVLPDYADGVWLVELASLADPALIVSSVAAVLGVGESGRPLREHLAEVLRPRAMLVVLDNCEHLVQGCAELTDGLLRACPNLKFLTTGRQALNIDGEVIWRVPGLIVPEQKGASLKAPQDAEAVRLFVERARAVVSDFRLTEHNSAAVAEVCCRLDGIPLAIELAAGRTNVLTPHEIASRVGDRFRVLVGGSRTAPRRQKTLRATLDWSYALLSAPEQMLFSRLSVFAGGYTFDAAEAVCTDPEDPADQVRAEAILDLIGRLVEQSLVVAEPSESGDMRYRLLETLRQYAHERLREMGEDGKVRGRHRDWYLALAEAAWLAMFGPDQRVWIRRLEREHDNMRAALEWSLQDPSDIAPALRLAGALHRFWWRYGHLAEGRAWLVRTLERDAQLGTRPEPAIKHARLQAMKGAGVLARAQGQHVEADAMFAASLALARELDDTAAIADGLYWVGLSAFHSGQFERAPALMEESLALWRKIDDPSGMSLPLGALGMFAASLQSDYKRATVLHHERLRLAFEAGDVHAIPNVYIMLGSLACQQGQHERATQLMEAGRRGFLELEDRAGLAWALSNIGQAARARGATSEAVQRLGESLVLFQRMGAMWGVAECLEGVAGVLCDLGQFESAAPLIGSVAALRQGLGLPLTPRARARQERELDAACAALGAARLNALKAAGEALDINDAIAQALALAPSSTGSTAVRSFRTSADGENTQ